MLVSELSNEARRQLIDVQQCAEALRSTEVDLRCRFAGSMSWKRRGEVDYLYLRKRNVERSLGRRSAESEAVLGAFASGKASAEARRLGLRGALERMAPVNRAMGLGRVPTRVANILRRLDKAEVMGEQVCVIGTNALFAYEAMAGVRFDSDPLATADLDIALDARRRLRLAARTRPKGLLELLRGIDPTFSLVSKGSYRAVNATGMMLDLVTAEPRHPMREAPADQRRLGGSTGNPTEEDLHAVEVPRMEMIVDAPRVTCIAVAEDGLPVWLAAADARWWAAHKLWLSDEPGREPIRRRRDRDQARAVARLIATAWTHLSLDKASLASIPAPLQAALRTAVASARADYRPPEW